MQFLVRPFCAGLVLAGLLTVGAAPPPVPPAGPAGETGAASTLQIDFNRDIRPIFESRCYDCHGEKKQKSGLRLDRKSSVLTGGDSGKPAIVAGRSAQSPLIQPVTSADEDEVMPPKGQKLTDAQLDLFLKWID